MKTTKSQIPFAPSAFSPRSSRLEASPLGIGLREFAMYSGAPEDPHHRLVSGSDGKRSKPFLSASRLSSKQLAAQAKKGRPKKPRANCISTKA